ncbi:unnamed protein product [Musa textilis]
MPEPETPNVSAPATPGTPGAPLFNSLRVDSLSYDRKSMPRCNRCLPLESWASSPHTCFTELPKPDVSLTRKLGAEFVGTFILIFGATAAPIVNQKYNGAETLIGNAACAGLAVMIVILSTGHISGAHLNPSLTIAFAMLRHFPWAQVPAYIVAQVSASICASFALKGRLPPLPLRRRHRALRQLPPGLLHRVPHHLQPPLRRHRRRHRHSRRGGIGWNRGGGHGHAQHSGGRAIERGIDEPGSDAWAGGRGRQLRADMDISGGADGRGNHGSRRLHGRQAQGGGRRDATAS